MVPLFGEELDRESTHISHSIRTTLFTTRRAETKQDGSFLPDAVEELSGG